MEGCLKRAPFFYAFRFAYRSHSLAAERINILLEVCMMGDAFIRFRTGVSNSVQN